MRTYELKTIPAVRAKTEKIVSGCECDLCGAKGDDAFDDGARDGWRYDISEVNVKTETKVSRVVGSSYPEGGSKKIESFDVCPRCWTEKVVPWFAQQGAKPTIDDIDW